MNKPLVKVDRNISMDAIRMSQEFGPAYVLCHGDGQIWDSDTHNGNKVMKPWSWKQRATAISALNRRIVEDPNAFLCYKGEAMSFDNTPPTNYPSNQTPANNMKHLIQKDPREIGFSIGDGVIKNSETNNKKVLILSVKKESQSTVIDPIAVLSDHYQSEASYKYDRNIVESLLERGFPTFVFNKSVYCYPRLMTKEFVEDLLNRGFKRIFNTKDIPNLIRVQSPTNSVNKAASVQFLTGKDYPYLCTKCRLAIDNCVELVSEGPDTDDIEAPLMFAADHGLLCGGNICKEREKKESGKTKRYCLKKKKKGEDAPVSQLQKFVVAELDELMNLAKKNKWIAKPDNSIFGIHYVDSDGNTYWLDTI